MYKPKSKGDALPRKGKTLPKAIAGKPIKRNNGNEGSKRCFGGAQHGMREQVCCFHEF
jgi:hypothetical protein